MPKNLEGYEQVEIDGTMVYYKSRFASLFKKVTIKKEKFLLFEFLVAVSG